MSLVRSNDYNGYTVGIALTFQAKHLPLKPHCLIHEKIKDLNRTQQTSILSSWLRMDSCFLQFFLQIRHVHQPHPIIIDWMIVVIGEKVLDPMVPTKTTSLIKQNGGRAVPVPTCSIS